MTTVMMVCDNYQLLADHNRTRSPRNFNTTMMNNTGMAFTYQYDYRSDKRIFLQRNATGQVTGNLLLLDAKAREWKYLFLFSTYYDIDWLAIDEKEGFIGYRVNNFKVQWWFNYRGYSKVTRIFSNMWESNQTNWNMLTNTAGQIGSNGQLKYTGLAWDETDTLVPTVQTLAGYSGEQMKVMSNAGRTYWAAANPSTNTILVFTGINQIFRRTEVAPLFNYGMKLIMSEDQSSQAILAVAYQKLNSPLVFIDLYRPYADGAA